MSDFIDRKNELESLERIYRSGVAELVILYGRRRVGKTELLKRFFHNKKHLYFLGDLQKEEKLLEMLSKIERYRTGVQYLDFRSWDAFFDYIKELSNERIILVFDEVGYINKSNPAFYSILQKHWDEHLQNTKIMLVLCGSSVSMMEKEVLGYGSPLYGRRTRQIELNSLKYRDARLFFPFSMESEKIEFYSILGGIPAYLNKFNNKRDVLWNIKHLILNTDQFLYKEPKFILLEELREPATYFSILSVLAGGAGKFSEISQKSYVESTKLSKYIQVLIDLRIVERIKPITEKKEMRRNSIYKIKDNYFNFWFRFIHPSISQIEEGTLKPVLERIVEELNDHVSKIFEEVCREVIALEHKEDFAFTRIGSWWDRNDEIDIVALNEKKKNILFGECKWTNKKVDMDVIKNLEIKASFVKWQNDERSEQFAIFSKSGFTAASVKYASDKNISLYTLIEIEKIFAR